MTIAEQSIKEQSIKDNSNVGPITQESTVGSVVKQYPEVIDTLLGFGVHCVGCHVAEWEPLGDGLRGHGMGDEQVDMSIAKLNEVIENHKSEKTTGENFTFTGLALGKIKQVLEKENKQGLRIKVEAGGCAGHSYGFSLTDGPKEDEKEMIEAGVKVFINAFTLEKMKGSAIDYVDGLQGAGFKVTNPNAKETCGCGTSFG
jgi:iron-sulfur cluster assembly accessory protein